jgi:hypothetical protein
VSLRVACGCHKQLSEVEQNGRALEFAEVLRNTTIVIYDYEQPIILPYSIYMARQVANNCWCAAGLWR